MWHERGDRASRWRRLRRVALAALLCGSIQTGVEALELLDLPLDHWAYEMLERLEVRAGLDRTGLDMRPLRRGQVARVVRRLQQSAAGGEWSPTRIEGEQLDMLRAEFSEELVAQGDSLHVLERAYHRWGGQRWQLQLYFVGRESFSRTHPSFVAPQSQVDARVAFEPAGALQLGEHFLAVERLAFLVRTTDGSLQQGVDPGLGVIEYVYEPGDRFAVTRAAEPYVRFGAGPLLVSLGRERLSWGTGRHNALLVFEQTPPLDGLRLELDFGWLRFAHVTGQLRPTRLLEDDPDFSEKYVAMHRLVLQPHRRLLLGVSDAVVWGERGIDLAYANPLAIFYVTQANIGDRDNALAGFDWKLLLPDLELYGELVVDDLNLRRGLDDSGNKVGLLGGLLWLEPFGGRDWELEFEWSWAGQFTYTHLTPVNRYEHYGATLGSRAGTDADLWVLRLGRRLSRGWTARAVYELERHGEGGIEKPADPALGEEQDYLSGTVEGRQRGGLQLVYRGLRNLEMLAEGAILHVTHPGNDAAGADFDSYELRTVVRLEF